MLAIAVRKQIHRFVLTLAGASEIGDAMENALYGAGCDDALLWSRDGGVHLDFDREAETLGDAINSAVKDVERAGFAVARVEVEKSSGNATKGR